MIFGPYPEGWDLIRFEETEIYKRIQPGIKMADFLLARSTSKSFGKEILIIEAKTSAPHPNSKENFQTYMAEVREKCVNGLSLTLALGLERHADTEEILPENFKKLTWNHVQFRLLLIVRTAQKEWLAPLQETLTKELRATVKLWALGPSSVAVFTQERAAQAELIQNKNSHEHPIELPQLRHL